MTATDEAVKAAVMEALVPFAGKPLSPENIEAIKDAATEALFAFEMSRPDASLDHAQCRRCVEVGVEEMLREVAREMAGEANAPGGDA